MVRDSQLTAASVLAALAASQLPGTDQALLLSELCASAQVPPVLPRHLCRGWLCVPCRCWGTDAPSTAVQSRRRGLQASARTQPELACACLTCAALAFPGALPLALWAADGAQRLLPEASLRLLSSLQAAGQAGGAQNALLGLLQRGAQQGPASAQLLASVTASWCREGLLERPAA